MKTQHQYSTATKRTQNVAMMAGMVGMLTILVVGSLFTLINRPTQIKRPTASGVNTPTRFVPTNRIFQDEINAAAVPTQDASPWQNFNWPERLSGMRPMTPDTASPVVAVTNRLFQDEMYAAGVLDIDDTQSPFFVWPEYRPSHAAIALKVGTVPANQPRPATTNRFFLDEIAGRNAVSDDMTLTAPEVTSQNGPR